MLTDASAVVAGQECSAADSIDAALAAAGHAALVAFVELARAAYSGLDEFAGFVELVLLAAVVIGKSVALVTTELVADAALAAVLAPVDAAGAGFAAHSEADTSVVAVLFALAEHTCSAYSRNAALADAELAVLVVLVELARVDVLAAVEVDALEDYFGFEVGEAVVLAAPAELVADIDVLAAFAVQAALAPAAVASSGFAAASDIEFADLAARVDVIAVVELAASAAVGVDEPAAVASSGIAASAESELSAHDALVEHVVGACAGPSELPELVEAELVELEYTVAQ